MYSQIFLTNVLRLLDERGMTRQELSEASGVSISFLSDIANDKGNPSLDTMEAIAASLKAPLPMLLEVTDLDHDSLMELAAGRPISTLPDALPAGFVRVWAIVTEHQAFQIRKWDEAAKKKLAKG